MQNQEDQKIKKDPNTSPEILPQPDGQENSQNPVRVEEASGVIKEAEQEVKEEVKERVVGVQFINRGKVSPFLLGEEKLRVGDHVVVETEQGENFGMVAFSKHDFFGGDKGFSKLKRILRKVTPEDRERVEKNHALEREGTEFCQKKIEERKIPMKLSRVEFSFEGNKATFFFTAEGRVDFRELVRDLANHFKTKIEMKQIGVRDEARLLGGCGSCGIKLCCASFLKDFEPVSIKMAKDQNLTLNPVKISGLCGRLMCCLVYEHENYKVSKKKLPVCGTCVKTESGIGTVDRIHLLQEKVTVVYPEEGKKELLSLEEFTIEKKGVAQKPKKVEQRPDKKVDQKPKNADQRPKNADQRPKKKKGHSSDRPHQGRGKSDKGKKPGPNQEKKNR